MREAAWRRGLQPRVANPSSGRREGGPWRTAAQPQDSHHCCFRSVARGWSLDCPYGRPRGSLASKPALQPPDSAFPGSKLALCQGSPLNLHPNFQLQPLEQALQESETAPSGDRTQDPHRLHATQEGIGAPGHVPPAGLTSAAATQAHARCACWCLLDTLA